MSKATPCDHIEVLISGLLDGELTQQQQQQVHVHLASCQACREQLADMQSLSHAMRKQPLTTQDTQLLQQLTRDQPSRWGIVIGFSLVVASLAILMVFAVTQFWQDATVNLWMKLTVSTLVIGFILLFLSTARQRFIAAKSDKYKKVNL